MLDLPDGLRLRAVVCEPPAPADGGEPPTALFLHGWGCSAYAWQRVLRPVADAGVRAVAVDLPGHGWSDKPLDRRRYTLDAFADATVAALDALALPRALVVGHSMGGAIAVHAASRAPDRVAGLVLVSPVGFGTVGPLRLLARFAVTPLDAALAYLAPRAFVRLALHRAYARGTGPTPRDVDEFWAPTADPRFARALRLLTAAVDWSPVRRELAERVRCPALVLFGDADRVVRARDPRRYVALLREGELELLPGVGHVVPDEATDAVIAGVVRSARAWR